MGRSRILVEEINYIDLYRGKLILINISRKVMENGERLSNIIRDIGLLMSVGIRVAITYFGRRVSPETWRNIDPAVLLDVSDLSVISKKISRGMTPIIFLGDVDLSATSQTMVELAKETGAIKIIYVTKYGGVYLSHNKLVSDMDLSETKALLDDPDSPVALDMLERLKAAVQACEAGILRVHIIGSWEGSLLKEVMTSGGSGTMVYCKIYKDIRPARPDDVTGIFEVIQESNKGNGESLSLAMILKNIDRFLVFTVDDQIHGCVFLRSEEAVGTAEISYLSVSPVYDNDPPLIRKILEAALGRVPAGIKRVFLDPVKNIVWLRMYPWFSEIGFSKQKSHSKWVREM